jgi:hypothetical protein
VGQDVPRKPTIGKEIMEELYFCLHLTENEHYIASWDFQKKCEELGLTFIYYRKLKEGHVPMYREVKVKGDRLLINQFKRFMKDKFYDEQVERNPHKLTE